VHKLKVYSTQGQAKAPSITNDIARKMPSLENVSYLTFLETFIQLCLKLALEKNDPNFNSKTQNLQYTDDDNRSYRNVCNMSLMSFSLAVIFIIKPEISSKFSVN